MIRLIVMRHAKSDWDAGVMDDHARPLNERGRREAPMVAEKLLELGIPPEYIVSSDATRTRETYERLATVFTKVPVRFARELYHAGLLAVRALAPSLPREATTVMVLGHNPGWQEMVSELSGEEVEMKTAYAAVLESEAADFTRALAKGARMRLVTVVAPR